jgi:glycine cleavage system regulatory protein
MTRAIILTLIGSDRPGLVERVANAITAVGGNWLESRMAHLGGQFAGILRAEIAEEQEESLRKQLAELEGEDGLTIAFRFENPQQTTPQGDRFHLELVAPDQPGIVSAITRALAARGVNVEEFTSGTSSAPMSGETMFRAEATLNLPSGVNATDVRVDLERISASLMADLTVTTG